MEQQIRFCDVDGRRLAYATVGEGPLMRLRRPLRVASGGGVGRSPTARVLRGARADASGRPLRPARHGALRAAAAGPADRGARDAVPRLGARGGGGRAGDPFRVLVRRPCDRALCGRAARARPQAGLLRHVRGTRRHPGGHAPVARRLRPRELDARDADVRRPAQPARQRRRDRRAQPLQASRGGGGGRRRIPRPRPRIGRARARAARHRPRARRAPPR